MKRMQAMKSRQAMRSRRAALVESWKAEAMLVTWMRMPQSLMRPERNRTFTLLGKPRKGAPPSAAGVTFGWCLAAGDAGKCLCGTGRRSWLIAKGSLFLSRIRLIVKERKESICNFISILEDPDPLILIKMKLHSIRAFYSHLRETDKIKILLLLLVSHLCSASAATTGLDRSFR